MTDDDSPLKPVGIPVPGIPAEGSSASIHDPSALQNRILERFMQVGPLCAGQLSTDFVLKPSTVIEALKDLEKSGFIEQRPDRSSRKFGEAEIPWGIPKLFRFRRQLATGASECA